MGLSQDDFESIVKKIYKVEFSKEIETLINGYIQKLQGEEILYEGKSFVVLSDPSEWKPTDETFVWIKTIDVLIEAELIQVIFCILEMKGHSKPNLWLNFPGNGFSGSNLSFDHTFPFTDDIIDHYDFEKYIVKPFNIEDQKF